MRVSDADRQRVIDELRRHCGAGRLDVDEYAARIERALAATTLVELDDLLVDLPMVRIADPIGARHPSGSKSSRGPWRALGTGRSGEADGSDAYEGGSYATKGRALSRRMASTTVALLTVVVVLSVVVAALMAQWVAVALLLVGWLIGMVQGRMGTPRR